LVGALAAVASWAAAKIDQKSRRRATQSARRLDPGTDLDPAQGLAVVEKNVARLEHRAEHSEESPHCWF
jgi:hypothetical protein